MSETQPKHERSFLARIFLSPEEPRLRAGWRLLTQTLLLLVFGAIIVIVGGFLGRFLRGPIASIWNQIINFLVITSSVYVARRWLDKRSFESLGLKLDQKTLPDGLAGIGITFVQMGFIYVVMLSLGWLTFEGFAWQFDPINVVITNVLTFFVVFIFVGWNEELLSRGYQLQTIASGLNLFWGVVLSSAVFGLLHLGNPNATWVSAAGIFFAGIYLALPMGISVPNNFGFPWGCILAGTSSKA